jgi:hypothetical protein
MAGDDRDPLDRGRPQLMQQGDDHWPAVDRQDRLRVALAQGSEPAALAGGHHDGFHPT